MPTWSHRSGIERPPLGTLIGFPAYTGLYPGALPPQRIRQAAVSEMTVKPYPLTIFPITCPPWMKLNGMRVAPAATSLGLLSKSHSRSPLTCALSGVARTLLPDRAMQRNSPGGRLAPSTEIFERSARLSQSIRILAACASTKTMAPHSTAVNRLVQAIFAFMGYPLLGRLTTAY